MTAVAALAAAAAAFAVTVAGAWVVARRRLAALERELRAVRELAELDPLTGLYNRRYFHDVLARELARAHRYGRSLALLLLDLDDFKAINDRIGHLGGDQVLAEAGACVRDVVRTADIACRIGGDELAVVLPEATGEDADRIYRRLQQALAARGDAMQTPLSASAGVAEVRAGDDAATFFRRADEALYEAKAKGKSQIARAAG